MFTVRAQTKRWLFLALACLIAAAGTGLILASIISPTWVTSTLSSRTTFLPSSLTIDASNSSTFGVFKACTSTPYSAACSDVNAGSLVALGGCGQTASRALDRFYVIQALLIIAACSGFAVMVLFIVQGIVFGRQAQMALSYVTVGIACLAAVSALIGVAVAGDTYLSWLGCSASICAKLERQARDDVSRSIEAGVLTGHAAVAFECGIGQGAALGISGLIALVVSAVLAGLRTAQYLCEPLRPAVSANEPTRSKELQELPQIPRNVTDMMLSPDLSNYTPTKPPPTAGAKTVVARSESVAPTESAKANDDHKFQPQGSDWEFDSKCGFYWSDSQELYFDPYSGHFYDGMTESWYDPQKREWYKL